MPELLIPVIAVLIVVIGGIALYVGRETRAETRKTGNFPKGHYMGQGMGIGMGLGVAIGLAMGTIAIGIPIGLAIGVAIGKAREKQHAHELRPMTEKETEMKRLDVMLMGGLMFATLLIAVGLYYKG